MMFQRPHLVQKLVTEHVYERAIRGNILYEIFYSALDKRVFTEVKLKAGFSMSDYNFELTNLMLLITPY